MNWKEYTETPDEGQFEAIQKRLRVRRAWRIGGGVAVLAAVAVVAAVALAPKEEATVSEPEMAVLVEPKAIVGETEEMADNTAAVSVANPVPERNVAVELPEPQMQMVAVAEPADMNVATTSPLAVPAVAPRRAVPVTKAEDKGNAQEVQEQGSSTEAAASTDAKFGGIEPEPYHEDNLLWAPNIIVPSGDKEENRVFKVIASSELQDFRMHIYNRGGRLVYSTSDIHAAWDATVGGTMVPQGAYVWVATFRDSDGVSRREAGTVTVVR